jgi:hypothetical protein
MSHLQRTVYWSWFDSLRTRMTSTQEHDAVRLIALLWCEKECDDSQYKQQVYMNIHITGRLAWMDSTPAMYAASPKFKSQLGDLFPWLIFSVIFFGDYQANSETLFQIKQYHIPSNSLSINLTYVSMASKIRTGRSRNRVRLFLGARDFTRLHAMQTAPRAYPVFCPLGAVGSFRLSAGAKSLGREIDQIRPSSTRFRNIMSLASGAYVTQGDLHFGVTSLIPACVAAYAISRRLPTVAALVRAKIKSCGNCGGQRALSRFSPSISVSLPVNPPDCYTLIIIYLSRLVQWAK